MVRGPEHSVSSSAVIRLPPNDDPMATSATSSTPSATGWAQREGSPLPLGVVWVADERAYNFALYSKHAERVVLLVYGEADLADPVARFELDYLHHKSGRVWHTRVAESELRGARYYAYSVAGPPPSSRVEWHAFDAEKVLLDPYADAIFFPPTFEREAAIGRGSNAGRAPLGIIPPAVTNADALSAAAVSRAPLHEADAVIYELHVRNFTRHPSSDVTVEKRGTFAGVVEKIPYLVDLGVTIVELMPVFQYDRRSPDRWGYMPMSFFALHDGYLSVPDPAAGHVEFRAMADALHDAGIELVLDVVYNHTAEGGHTGPVYGYKGIDNSTYYIMTGDAQQPYANYAGTGNTMNCANHAVRKMILDSMRHWVRLGVDGFRFDLASIYARNADGAFQYDDPPIIGEISADPEFEHVRLIAEPWDAGAYQLGRGFPGLTWHQWNGAFRDDVRRFLRGDPGMAWTTTRRLYGSDDLFPDERLHTYRPAQSVNYVTCHDGPTLYDLVSFNHKRNWANGHANTDGPPQSFGWNCGWEGDEHAPADVRALRVRQAKNFVTLLFLSNGTPMLRAGDEFLQTQRGNDNPYNQDDETTWLDWSRLEEHAGMRRFVKLAIAFRRQHPSLARSRFWRDDVRWFDIGDVAAPPPHASCLAFLLRGRSEGDADLYAMVNASQETATMRIQEGESTEWRRVIDTARSSPDDFRTPGDEVAIDTVEYQVGAHSTVVFVRSAGT
jgi:glycogen operon protein